MTKTLREELDELQVRNDELLAKSEDKLDRKEVDQHLKNFLLFVKKLAPAIKGALKDE